MEEVKQIATLDGVNFFADQFTTCCMAGQAHLDSLTGIGDIITISGWAFFDDPTLKATRVAVIDSEKRQGLGYAEITVERPDVKKVYEGAPVLCGFTFWMPLDLCSSDPMHSLMFYAVDETARVYMKIPDLYRMLSLMPFTDPDENIDANLKPYLTTPRLSWVDITATHRCNIDCQYCCLSGKHNLHPDADIEKLLEIVDTASGFVDFWQMSCLGEITIYPYWLTLAEKILEHRPFTLLSNFSKRFSDQELRMLAKAKFLTISIDTTDRALQKKIRRGSEVDRIVANIVAVRNMAAQAGLPGPNINLSAVVTPPVIPYLPSLALLTVSLGVGHLLIQDVSKILLSQATDCAFSGEEEANLASVMRDMLDILAEHGVPYTLLGSLRRYDKAASEPDAKVIHGRITKMCLAPWERMYMGLMGELAPCCYMGSVGRVETGTDLEKIANGTRMRAIRRGLLTGELEECCTQCRYGHPCSVTNLIERIEYYRNAANTDSVAFGLFE